MIPFKYRLIQNRTRNKKAGNEFLAELKRYRKCLGGVMCVRCKDLNEKVQKCE